jgi:hypothetical protein
MQSVVEISTFEFSGSGDYHASLKLPVRLPFKPTTTVQDASSTWLLIRVVCFPALSSVVLPNRSTKSGPFS